MAWISGNSKMCHQPPHPAQLKRIQSWEIICNVPFGPWLRLFIICLPDILFQGRDWMCILQHVPHFQPLSLTRSLKSGPISVPIPIQIFPPNQLYFIDWLGINFSAGQSKSVSLWHLRDVTELLIQVEGLLRITLWCLEQGMDYPGRWLSGCQGIK